MGTRCEHRLTVLGTYCLTAQGLAQISRFLEVMAGVEGLAQAFGINAMRRLTMPQMLQTPYRGRFKLSNLSEVSCRKVKSGPSCSGC